MRHILTLPLHHDQDVVTARQRATQIAALLGFEAAEQTRIATAVSEIVRNAFRYARGGEVAFAVDTAAEPQRFVVRVTDTGPGIAQLERILAGRYRSPTGLGMGIAGARRLMDQFAVQSSPAGTEVVLGKSLPARAPALTREAIGEIVGQLEARRPYGLIEEIQDQNRALLGALDEIQRKQKELLHLNRELEDTNRGVVALYAELDEKAEHLRRADELKSRFLSNMTHEFRTPVNAIIGLCNLLLDDRRLEGREPEPELHYIRKAADQLADLVNDLLDLAKVEAGKSVVRAEAFRVENLFGALRGMFRPLQVNQSVRLVFEQVDDIPALCTDEGKVAQILRNLISNALKFTERGEVRVAAAAEAGGRVTFSVADTGIGIALEDQRRIFEEFTQLEHRLQRGVRGTGLGLALSRRLAELLGGRLSVESQPGLGSTFRLTVPIRYGAGEGLRVLTIDDEEVARFLIRQCLPAPSFEVIEAATGEDGLRLARAAPPDVILLDLVMPRQGGREVLDALRGDPATAAVPVIVVTARALQPAEREALLAEAAAILDKRELSRDVLPGLVRRAREGGRPPV
jgi:signal transduction histidine kinase